MTLLTSVRMLLIIAAPPPESCGAPVGMAEAAAGAVAGAGAGAVALGCIDGAAA